MLKTTIWFTEKLKAVPVENDYVETDIFIITAKVVKHQSVKYVTFKLKAGEVV